MFELRWEWLDGHGTSVRSHALTWARLELRVDEDRVATRVYDRRTRSVRDGIYLPLMPLAEWVAYNWWFLIEEGAPELPSVSARAAIPAHRAWYARHNLLAAREGYPLPDLTCYREEDERLLLCCTADERFHGNAPVRFVERFEALVPCAEYRSALARLVTAVLERIEACDDHDARELRARWALASSDDARRRLLCARAAMLGLDAAQPDALDEALTTSLTEGLEGLPAPIVRELLALPGGALEISARAQSILAARVQTPRQSKDGALREARGAVLPAAGLAEPHDAGWAMARQFRRSVLGVEDEVVSAVLDHRLEATGVLDPHDLRGAPTDRGLLGWVEAQAQDTASCVLQRRTIPGARRFLHARALALALLGGRERLITESTHRSQRVARHFAAEVLAPAEAIRRRLVGEFVDGDELEALAAHFNVHPTLVRHQIENHHMARVLGE
ncbi:MAG: hypothetical protein HY909_19460 [Deltaproteobacteria bacterium]|nr:hypothetical protein [Deltaproteobacteria bacterium]